MTGVRSGYKSIQTSESRKTEKNEGCSRYNSVEFMCLKAVKILIFSWEKKKIVSFRATCLNS